MRKVLTYIFGVISILSLCYYACKFYLDQILNFEDYSTVFLAIIFVIMFGSLVLGLINAYNNNKLLKQNDELKSILIEVRDSSENNKYDILEAIYNSRDISLDTYNLIYSKENKG